MPNIAILSGRLTSEPELRYTASGVPVCNFCIAVPRPYKAGEDKQADFINVVAWRQTAEFVSKYFNKGSGIEVNGSIRTDSWLGDDGRKNYKVEILAEKVEFPISTKKADTEQAKSSYSAQEASVDNFMPVGDEDIPF